jgi:protein-disulfide isomerase
MKKISLKKNLPKIIIITAIVAVIGFVVYALSRPESSVSPINNNRPKVEADASKLNQGNFLGPENAKVTLSEFGDYQCPACGQYHKFLKENLLPKYDGKIKFVFLNYPLPQIHDNAQPAAQAAEAAALQGKFWQMHDILYERQKDWENLKDPRSKFESYAKEIGINLDQYKQDFASQKVIDIINNQAALGDAFKLEGTPSFFVNGVQVDTKGGSSSIEQAIEKALAQ